MARSPSPAPGSSTGRAPPPLPASLSSRLLSTIDPKTGKCKHHPDVKLCELVKGGKRWAVRRKICYKCGSRPGATGGGRHRPGVSVINPMREREAKEMEKNAEQEGGGKKKGGGRRSRSHSVDRTGAGDKAERRRRSTSTARSGASKAKRRSKSASRSGGGREDDMANNPLAASAQRLQRRRGPSRRLSKSMGDVLAEAGAGAGGGADPDDADDADGGPPPEREKAEPSTAIVSKSRKASATSSFHGRALEFTQKVMEESINDGSHRHSSSHRRHHSTNGAPVHPSHGAIISRRHSPPPPSVDEREDFDESDPIIMIPINIGGSDELPPPPPRPNEEMERHQERLEMRRVHIRREREGRRKRRVAAARGLDRVEEGGTVDSKRDDNDRKNHGGDPPPQDRGVRSSRRSRGSDPEPASRGPSAAAMALLGGEDPPPQNGSRKGRRQRAAERKQKEPAGGDSMQPSAAAMALLGGGDPPPQEGEPSAAAMALLGGGDPPPRNSLNKGKKKGGGRRKHASREDDVHPSSAAMALLGADPAASGRQSPGRRGRAPRKKDGKKDQVENLSRMYDKMPKSSADEDDDADDDADDDEEEGASETSSISTASAKRYRVKDKHPEVSERVRRHPELEGVALPRASRAALPPTDIQVRPRSLSRPRSSAKSRGSAETPSTGVQTERIIGRRGKSLGASHRRATGTDSAPVKAKKPARQEKHVSMKEAEGPRRHRSTSGGRPRGRREREDFHKSAPALEASSKLGGGTGRVWDVRGNDVASNYDSAKKGGSSRKKAGARQSVRSSSPSRASRGVRSNGSHAPDRVGPDGNRRSKSCTTRGSKGGRSRKTDGTCPESLSSEEMMARRTASQEERAPRSRRSVAPLEEEEEDFDPEPEPVVIKKKRARRKNATADHPCDVTADQSQHAKPMGLIACSSDDRSRASSISSSSTIDESYALTGYGEENADREGGGEGGDNSRAKAKDRAVSALSGVKGAMKLGTRRKSALGGLKGTSRKWQSALFM